MDRQPDIGVAFSAAVHPIAETLLADGVRQGWRPSNDSSLGRAMASHGPSGDEERLELRPPLDMLCDALFVRCLLLVDNLRALSLTAVHGSHSKRIVALSLAPVSRTALEALAAIYWLCEPGHDPSERVHRMVIDVLDSFGKLGGLNRWPPREGDGPIEPDWDDLEETLGAWRVPTRRSEKAPHAVYVVNAEGKGRNRPTAQAILAPLMQSEWNRNLGAYIYADLSRIAHASVDGILSRARVSAEDGALHYRFSRDLLVGAAATIVWAVHRPLQAYYEVMEWDFSRLESAVASGIELLEPRLEPLARTWLDQTS